MVLLRSEVDGGFWYSPWFGDGFSLVKLCWWISRNVIFIFLFLSLYWQVIFALYFLKIVLIFMWQLLGCKSYCLQWQHWNHSWYYCEGLPGQICTGLSWWGSDGDLLSFFGNDLLATWCMFFQWIHGPFGIWPVCPASLTGSQGWQRLLNRLLTEKCRCPPLGRIAGFGWV